MLQNQANVGSSDLRFSVIGGVVLIDASGELDGAMAERLGHRLEQLRRAARPVVLDLTRVIMMSDEAVAVLRAEWRKMGDGLRVVASPDSAPARALTAGRTRRFALHASLSGALADAAAR